MLATMLIEFGGAVYAAWRYKLNSVGRLIVAVLVLLGVFQLAEYMICEQIGLLGLTWARVGHVAITMLPPLGISLAMRIAKKENWPLETSMYAACIGFIAYFGFASSALSDQTCQGNYVIFTANPSAMLLYGAYYHSLLIASTALCYIWANQQKDSRRAEALAALAIGYLVFIIPTIVVNLIAPETRAAIPSVMCGFAVLLAVILLAGVLPRAGLRRESGILQGIRVKQ